MRVGGTIFALWLGMALLLMSAITVMARKSASFEFWWAAILLLASCAALLKAQRRGGVAELDRGDRNWYFALTLLALGLRAWNLTGPSIWLDEDVQALASTFREGHDLVLAAALQQQPPLDYFLTAFNLRMLGWNEWGSRLSAWILGSLAVGAIFLLGVRAKISRAPLVLVTALAALNPWLIRYAQEGRPVSTAIFCYLLLLLQMFSYWQTPSKVGLMGVWAVSNFFLLSIGFQPPLLLGSLFVTGLFILAQNPEGREKFIKLSGAIVGSAVFCLPILLLTVRTSPQYLAPDERVTRLFDPAHLKVFLYFLGSFFGSYWGSVLVALVVLGAVLRPRPAVLRKPLLTATVVLVAVSLTLKYGVFYFFIQWVMSMRYLLVGLPVAFLALALAVDQMRQAKSRQLVLGGIGILAIWSGLQLPQAYSKVFAEGSKAFYSFLEADAEPESGVLLLSFASPERWSPEVPFAQAFYVSPDLRSRVYIPQDYPSIAADHLIKAITAPAQFRTVYLVDLPGWSGDERYPLEEHPDWREVPRYVFNNVFVYKVKIPDGTTFAAHIVDRLERLEAGGLAPPQPFWLRYTLFGVAIAKPDCARARELLERLKPVTGLSPRAQDAVDARIQRFQTVCGSGRGITR